MLRSVEPRVTWHAEASLRSFKPPKADRPDADGGLTDRLERQRILEAPERRWRGEVPPRHASVERNRLARFQHCSRRLVGPRERSCGGQYPLVDLPPAVQLLKDARRIGVKQLLDHAQCPKLRLKRLHVGRNVDAHILAPFNNIGWLGYTARIIITMTIAWPNVAQRCNI